MDREDQLSPFQITTRRQLRERIRQSWECHGRRASRPGFKAVALHAFGQWRMSVRPRFVRLGLSALYRVLYRRCCSVYGIELPYTVRLGERVIFEHQKGIVIHGNCEIGDDCIIRHGVTLGNRYLERSYEAPRLGNRVNVGAGAVILGNVRLGDDVQVGANAVVLDDVPAGSTVTGPKAIVRPPREAETKPDCAPPHTPVD